MTEQWQVAAALAALPVSPSRLRRLLSGHEPGEAWDLVVAGRHPADPGQELRRHTTASLVERVAAACEDAGVQILVLGSPRYPAALADDAEAPAVLFAAGDPTVADCRPRVCIVGTRSATAYGLGVAAELGGALAAAGVVVVSGLARGIDSAAHAAAVRTGGAPVVGVVGAPIGTPAGAAAAALQRAVVANGALLSEVAPGAPGARWNFALRNRIMAALAHAVVVVEAHRRSGARYTVQAACARGIWVGSVPGSIRSPASAGTNDLLADGADPVRDVEDVMTALRRRLEASPEVMWSKPPRRPPSPRTRSAPRAPTPLAGAVGGALSADPATLEQLAVRSGLGIADLALGLEQLAQAGLAEGEGGWWSLPRHG